MKRFLWNCYTALYIAVKCGTTVSDGWRCARESTDMFEDGLYPDEVADFEKDVRSAENNYKPKGN